MKKRKAATYTQFNYRVHIVTTECQILGEPPLLLPQGKDEPLAIPVPERPSIFVTAYNMETDEEAEMATYEVAVSDTEEAQTVLEAAGWRISGVGTTLAEGFFVAPVEPTDWDTLISHMASQKRNAEAETARADKALRFIIQDAANDRVPAAEIATAAGLSPARIYQIRDGK